jgi:hypothetical protein
MDLKNSQKQSKAASRSNRIIIYVLCLKNSVILYYHLPVFNLHYDNRWITNPIKKSNMRYATTR